MDEKNNKNTIYKIITILLLIIIIILLLYFNRFGEIDNKGVTLIPTGNVDVFDIDINCNCKTDTCEITDKDGNTIPVFNEVKDKNITGKVFVDDDIDNYLYQERLQIFKNAAYNFTNKIAPGVSNVYHFVVHNSTNTKLKYKIKMYEESEYKLNMEYRLKNDNNYIIGDDNTWVKTEELETTFKNIDKQSSDDYSLEWRWNYDKNDSLDNYAGINMESEYKLNIRVNFEAI